MAINCNILTEYLDGILLKKITHKGFMPVSYVSVYSDALPIRSHTLYILEDPVHFSHILAAEQSSFIIQGEIDCETFLQTRHEVICVERTRYTTAELLLLVTEVLEKYAQWEEKLSRILTEGGTITELCQASVPYFENTMVVQNKDFELFGVGETDEIRYPYVYREGKSKYLASDIVLQGVIDADVIYAEKTPFLYDYVPGYPSLLYNIFLEGQYVAQICVDAVYRPFRDSDYSKICLLGRYIKTCIIHMPNHGRILSDRLQRSFYLYFCEGIEQFQPLLFAMQQTAWRQYDTYLLCALDVTQTEKRNIGSGYLCNYISFHLPSSVSFRIDRQYLCLICNITRSQMVSDAVLRVIGEIQQKFGFTVGVSDIFSDVFFSAAYFSQAKAAIATGIRWTNAAVQLYLFSEYRLIFLLEQGSDALPYTVLEPPELKALAAYDETYHTQLVSVMRIYLRMHCHVTETAEKMKLSRNTLKNRLKKIREIMQRDLTDCDENLCYAMLLERKFYNDSDYFFYKIQPPFSPDI